MFTCEVCSFPLSPCFSYLKHGSLFSRFMCSCFSLSCVFSTLQFCSYSFGSLVVCVVLKLFGRVCVVCVFSALSFFRLMFLFSVPLFLFLSFATSASATPSALSDVEIHSDTLSCASGTPRDTYRLFDHLHLSLRSLNLPMDDKFFAPASDDVFQIFRPPCSIGFKLYLLPNTLCHVSSPLHHYFILLYFLPTARN